jgi:asparagine synthase (glutamine-hydrolysing)
VVDGLRHPPCLVSFSGGHDSTLVLTAAATAARRHGLDLPVPVTWRFVAAPRADESDAQDEVVRALSLPDWERLVAEDDLDFVGPVARQVLGRHGVLHPVNAFLHAPLLAKARGGSLLTGVGGDQLLASWRPGRRLHRPYRPPRFPWLHPAHERRHRRRLWWDHATEPRHVRRRLWWQAGRRNLRIGCQSLEILAQDVSAQVLHPLLDRRFVSAVADRGLTPERAGGRAALFRELFGPTFPDFVYRRRPKANLGEVFWRAPTQEVISRWDGRGVDAAAVDLDALRSEWAKPAPSLYTAMLVQQAWLASQ